MSEVVLLIEPRTSCLGADVSGIDLSKPLDDATHKSIRRAWLDHKVLFFWDQQLSPAEHQQFGEQFGPAQPVSFVPTLPDYPAIKRQEQPGKAKVSDVVWHSDDVFAEYPSKGSILYALDVPAKGGNTVWADLETAYDALSDYWKRFLSDLTATHISRRNMMASYQQFGAEILVQSLAKYPPIEHPVIRTHPETGRKAIFVNELMTTSINGMSHHESEAVLQFLFQHTQKPDYQVHLSWKKGTVAFWDNRCTMHRGIYDFGDNHRLMHRYAIADDSRPQ